MIRKPKVYFGIETRGIKFRERWNIVEMSTEAEFKEYIKLEKKIEKLNGWYNNSGNRWDPVAHAKLSNERVKQQYIRKCWRIRYGNQFKKSVLYKISKKIHRYNCKISPQGANGVMGLWTLRRGHELRGLSAGDIIMYSHTDEIGTHYFSRADQVDSPHLYVFKQDDFQLCAIVPLEET